MDEKTFVEKFASMMEAAPKRADVLSVRQYSVNELQQRVRRILTTTGSACGLNLDRGDMITQEDRTLIRLPMGAQAVVYHASGAMQLVTGLPPMEALFKRVENRERLIKLVEETAAKFNFQEWVGPKQRIAFERLWQIKASATGREEMKPLAPVLCRVVGAYRHFVNDLPVLGAASVAVKLAGEGALDSLTVQIRESTGEVVDRVKIKRPDEAAREVLRQMSALMSGSKAPITEFAFPTLLQYGYFSLSKRQAQRYLAPVYVASVETGGEDPTARLFVIPAGDKEYLPICRIGNEALPSAQRLAK